ncbi:6-pyruvoyl trahydropterin synthase family protein [Halobellus limi]|uniref:6-carboxytetrahydropterin synthase n=1 Tax=Halobellus limi TaxID=699433 RepID=A0A1H6BDV0_9EURY|nr:6-carboxytetrahydropterin synthase [Halobellus limi]QCC49307.1 6-carboxytetrahydropterin synthase [Halobellus limi]SEG58993.1 6-pyruvoyltetrahydropterin/6-carboxytetrahydropterin synthase [Halobellus limi]
MTRTDADDGYELTVTRSFIAQHYLTVPDPGPEGVVHSHQFTVELRFSGPTLGEYGYLVDIDAVDALLDDLEARYRDALLNDLPEFEGLNPSIEHFARLFGDRVVEALADPNPTGLTVRIWEDDVSWASHSRRLGE